MTAPLSDTERRAPEECTGLAATWCPNCGDCTCSSEARDDPDCPLHRWTSDHAGAAPLNDESAADLDTLSALRREVAMLRDANEGRADEIDGLTAEVSALRTENEALKVANSRQATAYLVGSCDRDAIIGCLRALLAEWAAVDVAEHEFACHDPVECDCFVGEFKHLRLRTREAIKETP